MIELFKDIKIDWLGKRKMFFVISVGLLLIGMASLVQKRTFRYGVDFRGGTSVSVHFHEHVPVDQIRALMPKGAEIQEVGGVGTNDVLIEFESKSGDADASRGREEITQALNKSFQ